MISILTIKRKYWVTCPYPEYLLNDTFKIVYICALPLVFYLIFLTKIYSLFMAALIFIFKTIIVLLHLFRILAPTSPSSLKKSAESQSLWLESISRRIHFASTARPSETDCSRLVLNSETWSGFLCLNGKRSRTCSWGLKPSPSVSRNRCKWDSCP